MLDWVVAMGRGLAPLLLPEEIHLSYPCAGIQGVHEKKRFGGLRVSLPANISLPVHGRETPPPPLAWAIVHLQLYSSTSAKG